VKRARRQQVVRSALFECADILEAALGVDLGIYHDGRLGETIQEERDLVERTMRQVADRLYDRAETSPTSRKR
jgi:hypothetical protein